ncbi:hypothetical protein NDU88_002905 [Pleurodeles waltl]|uniref:Uncharacterized protein n=1 Tax=Pleurodeles waltl TaxID=8319 RepID=A0AAV7TPG0_PLEWA|nr:hypothetical protein NDU88_002905 [Pleurodeles waltl]
MQGPFTHPSTTTAKLASGQQGQNLQEHNRSLETKLHPVLEAIEHTRISLETRIANMATDLPLLHADHRKLADKVTVSVQTIVELQPKTQRMESSLRTLLEHVQALEK